MGSGADDACTVWACCTARCHRCWLAPGGVVGDAHPCGIQQIIGTKPAAQRSAARRDRSIAALEPR